MYHRDRRVLNFSKALQIVEKRILGSNGTAYPAWRHMAYRLRKHLGNVHQATNILRDTPTTTLKTTTGLRRNTKGTGNSMRQTNPNHSKQLRQNTASQKRHDNHHKDLHRVATCPAIDITEQTLDVADHALYESLAGTGSSRRR